MLERDGRKLAACSAHPFTTIAPNIASGYFLSPEDDTACSTRQPRDSRYGRCPTTQRRFLPVIVYDIAGLVPGAYQGRGKGNQFLNDITSADVLLHIVDASGKSDQEGNILLESPSSSSSSSSSRLPGNDAMWLRDEIHRWIANNVLHKWQSVVNHGKQQPHHGHGSQQAGKRVEARVHALFTGYHASASHVDEAARRAGLDLSSAHQWPLKDVHLLCAHFLRVRFPICLALNKVDQFDSVDAGRGVVAECQECARARGEDAIPCSALAETVLLAKLLAEREKEREMERSDRGLAENLEPKVCDLGLAEAVVANWGSTGVLQAISAAVALRPPTLVYPVSDLDSEAGIVDLSFSPTEALILPDATSASLSRTSLQHQRLPDCIIMKPSSTVLDLFEALKHGGALGEFRLSGEFVRAEARGLDEGSRRRVVGRECALGPDLAIIKISTNRKRVWQQQQQQGRRDQVTLSPTPY